jgi:hypothetical protein
MNKYHRYEAMKRDWIAHHPHATPEEYTLAMRLIAKHCKV